MLAFATITAPNPMDSWSPVIYTKYVHGPEPTLSPGIEQQNKKTILI